MEQLKPTISVLIRAHNAINRITTCINSVYYNQSVYPDKIFICDDCSSDGTFEYLSSNYKDDRVCLLHNDTHKGPGYSLKRLIYTCDTDYYLIIDDDDYWIRTDVIQVVRNDIVTNGYPDDLYYRSNDAYRCRLHVVFAYRTAKMQQLIYFSLWQHDDDYTLQILNDNFRETIIDGYVFYCPYVPHSLSRLPRSAAYTYLHRICKDIYLNNIGCALFQFNKFPFFNNCLSFELVIYNELAVFFNGTVYNETNVLYQQLLTESVFIQGSSLNKLGVFNGRMGLAIFCYLYSRKTDNVFYEQYADVLIDSIIRDLPNTREVNFLDGLAGIGWGFEYLTQNQFLNCDTNEVLEEFDQKIMQWNIQWCLDNSLGTGVLGVYAYVSARLMSQKNKDSNSPFPKEYINNLETLISKRPELHNALLLSFDDVWKIIGEYYLSNTDWSKYTWQVRLLEIILDL